MGAEEPTKAAGRSKLGCRPLTLDVDTTQCPQGSNSRHQRVAIEILRKSWVVRLKHSMWLQALRSNSISTAPGGAGTWGGVEDDEPRRGVVAATKPLQGTPDRRMCQLAGAFAVSPWGRFEVVGDRRQCDEVWRQPGRAKGHRSRDGDRHGARGAFPRRVRACASQAEHDLWIPATGRPLHQAENRPPRGDQDPAE